MFNPSDLEGEVDHSFFDSDCDDSSITRDGGKKMEKCLMAEKENQIAHERPHAKETENSGRTSASPVACTSEKVIINRSDSEEDSNLHSERPTGTFMALLTEPRQVDHQDAYSQSPNESDEEALPSSAKNSGSKGRNSQSSKKRTRNRCTRSPSPTSSEASVDADSEGSCSSSNGRRSSDSPILPRPSRSSLSPGMSRIRVDSAGSRDSDDTVTDVSPLSSSDASPLQSFDQVKTTTTKMSLCSFQAFLKRLESVKATPGIKRSEQLADYQRQVGYLRAPSYPLSVSATKKGRSAHSRSPVKQFRKLLE